MMVGKSCPQDVDPFLSLCAFQGQTTICSNDPMLVCAEKDFGRALNGVFPSPQCPGRGLAPCGVEHCEDASAIDSRKPLLWARIHLSTTKRTLGGTEKVLIACTGPRSRQQGTMKFGVNHWPFDEG